MDRNYFGITDTGKVRDNNEDTFVAARINGSERILACVIDGVGGYSGGEIAAEIAKESILEHLNTIAGDILRPMKFAILEADARIVKEKQLDRAHEKMACVLTVAVADLESNQFYYAHVGDTRLYLLRDQTLVKISKDQSFVGFMEDTGRLTEEQAMRHPKRNEINKAIGFGINASIQEDYIETGQSPFLPGDVILICSDGLSDMVNKEQMTTILTGTGTLEAKAEQLIGAANQNGGRDNITLVLVKNDKLGTQHTIAKPASVQVKKHDVQVSVPVRGKNQPDKSRRIILLLATCCVLLLFAIGYLSWENRSDRMANLKKLETIKPPRNKQEKKLQDTLNKMKGQILVLTDSMFQSPILITEPIRLNKDSVYLIAEKEIVFRRDSSFTEIPIMIMPACRLVSLENFRFENFQTAISSGTNALVLKNVRFLNSPNAIQIIYNFAPGKYINGKLQRGSFKTDSLPTLVTP